MKTQLDYLSDIRNQVESATTVAQIRQVVLSLVDLMLNEARDDAEYADALSEFTQRRTIDDMG